jgi:F0F1-type ATP synthase membrane subunit b/b'
MNFELPFYLSGIEVLTIVNFVLAVCLFLPLILLGYWFIFEFRNLDLGNDDFYYNNDDHHHKFYSEVSKSANANGDIKEGAYNEALEILDRARADSLKILGKAQAKAQNLLDNTYVISKENREKLQENIKNIYDKQNQTLSNLSEELLESYRLSIEEGKRENIRTLYEVTEAMKQEAIRGVDELKDVVKKETIEAQDALEDKVNREYAKVDAEIKEYKRKKIEGLNRKIFELLSNIYTEVLKQDLDQTKHEKLILELLEQELKSSGLKNSL